MFIIQLTMALNALLLLECSAAPSSASWNTNIPNIDAAMEGFDPVMSDPLERPDPGIRNQIFEPMQKLPDGNIVLNSFVDKVRENIQCDSELSRQTLRNFNEFRKEITSSYSFASKADTSVRVGLFGDKEQKMQKFFTETNGEVVQVKAECITHAVSIAPFEKPVFKKGFQTALRKLNVAAKTPTSNTSHDIFVDFVKSYGTHFIKNTYLGSVIRAQKLFTSKSINMKMTAERTYCATNFLNQNFGNSFVYFRSPTYAYPNYWYNCEGSSQDYYFFENNDIPSEKIFSVGSLSAWNTSDWSVNTKKLPAAIKFEFEKISKLFCSEWFNTILMEANNSKEEDRLDGAAMYTFWEEKMAQYYMVMLGKEFPSKEKGCGFNSDCAYGTYCVNDRNHDDGFYCTETRGGVVITGGRNQTTVGNLEVYTYSSNTVTLDTWNLPSLPYRGDGHTLTTVGTKLYSCGGYHMEFNRIDSSCYVLDTAFPVPVWSPSIRLPINMAYHSAVAVGVNIWFVFNNKIYDLNTTLNTFKSSDLPFNVSSDHCAVSNGTHSYVIGAGESKLEIWLNAQPSNPLQWRRVASLNKSKHNHDCLWLNSRIFITGGQYTNVNYSDAEILNTQNNTVVKTGSLNYARANHRMFDLDGNPAVVGGWAPSSRKYLNNIETYDVETMEWTVIDQKLPLAIESFGLAQLPI